MGAQHVLARLNVADDVQFLEALGSDLEVRGRSANHRARPLDLPVTVGEQDRARAVVAPRERYPPPGLHDGAQDVELGVAWTGFEMSRVIVMTVKATQAPLRCFEASI